MKNINKLPAYVGIIFKKENPISILLLIILFLHTTIFCMQSLEEQYRTFIAEKTKIGIFCVDYSWPCTRNLKEVSEFLKKGVDVNMRINDTVETDISNTLLHFVADGKQDVLPTQEIMNHPKLEVNIQNKYGCTPLHYTIFEIIPHIHTHKIVAARLSIAKKLLARNDIEPNVQNNEGKTPLLLALEKKRSDLVELLLTNKKTDPNIVPKNVKAPLLYPSIYRFTPLLKDRKIPLNLNIQDEHGNSPLHYAQNDAGIDFLLKHPDTNVNIKNNLGDTPLHCAIKKPRETNISSGFNEVYRFKMDCDKATCIINHPQTNINIKNNEGNTPLHYAVQCEYFAKEITDMLLRHSNIDVNVVNNDGHTPLDLAIKSNNQEVIELLQKDVIQDISEKIIHDTTQNIIAHPKQGIIQESFALRHKNTITICVLLGFIGLISASIFAYFHYTAITQ